MTRRLRGEQLRSLGRTLEALEAALGGLRAQVRELERAAKEARDVRRAEYPGVAAAEVAVLGPAAAASPSTVSTTATGTAWSGVFKLLNSSIHRITD